MRADRLLAVLLLLQRRESVTAAEVAAELEISVRTARRDLEALAVAGVPVYSTAGRGGGWRLVGGARTDLTGLTGPEVRALFLAAGSLPGQSVEVRRALGKLQRAVPAPFREQAEQAAQAVFVDEPRETGAAGSPTDAVVSALQEAVGLGMRAELDYRDRSGRASTRTVDPLGLVQRGRAWYLVADGATGRRTFRADRVAGVRVGDEPARRPPGFDLRTTWREITASLDRERPQARLTALADPWVVSVLTSFPWVEVIGMGAVEDDGRQRLELSAGSLDSLCGMLAGLVEGLEVVVPLEARATMARLGSRLVGKYVEADPSRARGTGLR